MSINHNVECKREVGETKKENITYIDDAQIVGYIQIYIHFRINASNFLTFCKQVFLGFDYVTICL